MPNEQLSGHDLQDLLDEFEVPADEAVTSIAPTPVVPSAGDEDSLAKQQAKIMAEIKLSLGEPSLETSFKELQALSENRYGIVYGETQVDTSNFTSEQIAEVKRRMVEQGSTQEYDQAIANVLAEELRVGLARARSQEEVHGDTARLFGSKLLALSGMVAGENTAYRVCKMGTLEGATMSFDRETSPAYDLLTVEQQGELRALELQNATAELHNLAQLSLAEGNAEGLMLFLALGMDEEGGMDTLRAALVSHRELVPVLRAFSAREKVGQTNITFPAGAGSRDVVVVDRAGKNITVKERWARTADVPDLKTGQSVIELAFS